MSTYNYPTRQLGAALFLLAAVAAAQTPVHTVSGNFPVDLYGPVDSRMAGAQCPGGPCIWGHADYAVLPIQFYPPAGYQVEIVSLRGDLIAWIKCLPGDSPIQPVSQAGILGGFQTTSSLNGSSGASGQEVSVECNYCSDGAPLYIQDSVTDSVPKTRAAYDYENVSTLLDSDNVFNAKIAAFLNTTTKCIHLELTYTIQFRYVPIANSTAAVQVAIKGSK